MKFAKLLSVMLLGIMLVTSVSFGQSIPSGTARYEALGYNPFIKDASIDINRNPAWSTVYRNYAFGDLGRDVVNQYELTDQWAGINFGVSKEVSLGLVLNKFEDNWTDFNKENTFGVQRPVVPLKVLFGWQMSPKFALGLAPYYAGWSSEYDSTGQNYKRNSSVFGGTVGVLGKLEGGWIEGAVDLKINKFKYDQTVASSNTVYENEGGMQMSVLTRGFFTVNKNLGVNLVPYIGFGMYGWNPNVTPSTPGGKDPKYSYLSFMFGLGINMPVLDNGLLAGGLSAGYNSAERKYETSNLTNTVSEFVLPQFNLGLEWPFTEWLTGRAGYMRSVSSTKDEWTGAFSFYNKGTGVSDSKQTITCGFGLDFNRFNLSGTVGEKLFKEGFYIMTGKTNDLFGVLSASYYFGK